MEESNFTPKKLNFKEEEEAAKKPVADDPVEDKLEEVGAQDKDKDSQQCTTIPHPD